MKTRANNPKLFTIGATLTLLAFLYSIPLAGISKAMSDDVETLKIGASAPDFNLEGTDNKFYTLEDFASSELLMIVFTCNHCPTAQAYEDRLIALSNEFTTQRGCCCGHLS